MIYSLTCAIIDECPYNLKSPIEPPVRYVLAICDVPVHVGIMGCVMIPANLEISTTSGKNAFHSAMTSGTDSENGPK